MFDSLDITQDDTSTKDYIELAENLSFEMQHSIVASEHLLYVLVQDKVLAKYLKRYHDTPTEKVQKAVRELSHF